MLLLAPALAGQLANQLAASIALLAGEPQLTAAGWADRLAIDNNNNRIAREWEISSSKQQHPSRPVRILAPFWPLAGLLLSKAPCVTP